MDGILRGIENEQMNMNKPQPKKVTWKEMTNDEFSGSKTQLATTSMVA